MKLNNIDRTLFNKSNDIEVNVKNLYFQCGDKEIYDILVHYIEQPSYFNKLIEVRSLKAYNHDYELINTTYSNIFHKLIETLGQTQKEEIINIALKDENNRAICIIVSNPEIKLTNEQFEKIFNNKNFSVRESIIKNKNIELSVEQINNGLLNYDSGLSLIYAKRNDGCILTKTIDTLINETNEKSSYNEDVLIELLKNPKVYFNENQVQHFLDSDNFILKLECAKNYGINFTASQIKQGLNDEGFESDMYDDTYNGYSETDVKKAFLKNPNIKLPEKEINDIIENSNSEYLTKIIAEREDLQLSDKNIEKILDKLNHSTASLLRNPSIHLNDNQILKFLYKNSYTPDVLIKCYFCRDNVVISDLVMSVLKTHPSEELEVFLKERENNIPSTKIKMR